MRRAKVGARNRTHGKTSTAEYVIWAGMIARCENPKHKAYKNWGGRGITVCERWRESFGAFLADLGPKPFKGACLDRIDNDGNYEPGNVRWVSNQTNCRNRSKVSRVTIDGVTKPLNDWAEERGLRPKTVHQRILRGATPLEALNTPLRTSGRTG